MHDGSDLIARYAALAPVIPVVTIEDPAVAVPLARTLVEAGLPVVEVTLRTERALAAIELIARDVPDAVVAAGTVTRPDHISAVAGAGAKLIVTPGTTPAMADALARPISRPCRDAQPCPRRWRSRSTAFASSSSSRPVSPEVWPG
jgi:2-dehydro-3-deoxyphosphogluconate aldolase/(4S)-4-hydroxy-2-oxoglutarate aldolase